MPKKKAPEEGAKKVINPNVMGLRPEVLEQPITETLEINYMPYAMSVIVSRAIPEIDGFKPSHRKLLYTIVFPYGRYPNSSIKDYFPDTPDLVRIFLTFPVVP